MISVMCGQCGKWYELNDGFAGKKAKCGCGAVIAVPSPGSAATAVSAGQVSQHQRAPSPAAKRTPLPSAPLTRHPAVSTPAIWSGDSSVIKAEIKQPSSHIVEGDFEPPSQPYTPAIPAIQAGEGSVVKASIDSSQSISVAGDMVSHKEVHAHHTTNVYNSSTVSALLGIAQHPAGGIETSHDCIVQLTRAIHSGVGARPFALLFFVWPVGLYLLITASKRKDAEVNVLLARLRTFLAEEPGVQGEYARLHALWESTRSSRRLKAIATASVVAGFFVLLFAFPIISMYESQEKSGKARHEIIRLLEGGHFDAARIRARDLPYSEHRDVLGDIESAERRWRCEEPARRDLGSAGSKPK